MKKVLLTLFQIAVTVGMLIWVFHDPNQRAKMAEALWTADYRWVGAGILAYILVEIFAAFRWQILLRVQKIQLSFPRIAGLFLIGMFYNQFLPGGTGGDIIKSYLLLKETPDKKAGALLAVVFDRLIGLVALVAITVTLVSLRFDILSKSPETRRLLWILLFLLGSSIAALLTSFIISGFNLFHWLPHKFPGREKLIEVSAAYHLYARHWVATFRCLRCVARRAFGDFHHFSLRGLRFQCALRVPGRSESNRLLRRASDRANDYGATD